MGVFVGVNQLRRVCEAYGLKPKAYAKSPPVRDRGKVKSSIPNLLKPVLEEADHIKKTKSTPLFDLVLGSAMGFGSTALGLIPNTNRELATINPTNTTPNPINKDPTITTITPIGIYKPNQVWASDFTYLPFQGLWYYLYSSIYGCKSIWIARYDTQ
jgi:hypothetical protein